MNARLLPSALIADDPSQVTQLAGSVAARVAALHTRRLLRIAFYADLKRKPPTKIAHMPSYVRAVKQYWKLQYNNSARQLLAEIEGFSSWEAMMSSE